VPRAVAVAGRIGDGSKQVAPQIADYPDPGPVLHQPDKHLMNDVLRLTSVKEQPGGQSDQVHPIASVYPAHGLRIAPVEPPDEHFVLPQRVDQLGSPAQQSIVSLKTRRKHV
jgi:hypothetical protein